MTILEEISFSPQKIQKKLGKSIKIDPKMKYYPNNPHTKDERWMNWCKDKFVPPLSLKELNYYIKKPAKFRQVFLDNLRFYRKFCLLLKVQIVKIKKLPLEKKLAGILSLLFLFQSAMDQHYTHFDFWLDLEEYPKSPLGWHYLRIKKILINISSLINPDDQKIWIDEQLLYLLSKKGRRVIKKFKLYLNGKQLKELIESYKAIQIYLLVQQEEEKLFYGKDKKGPIFTTGYAIWNFLTEVVKETKGGLANRKELVRILEGNPIWGTRKILVELDNFFSNRIVYFVQEEINRW